MYLIILLYAVFGSSFVFGKMLLAYTTPMFLTGIRMTIGGGLLLTYILCFAHEHVKFKRKHIIWYAQMIFFGVYVTYGLRFWALGCMPAAKTNFLYNLSPFMAALFSYFLFNERLTAKKWAGLAIGCLGLLPVLLTSSTCEQSMGELGFISWAELAVIASVVTHTYSWLVMRKMIKEKSYSPLMINGIIMVGGGILALITSYFIDGPFPVARQDWGPFFSLLAIVILLSNILCYNLYGWLLRHYTGTFLSFSGFLGPLFTALYGWIFLSETVGWTFFISCGIVIAGLYLFYQEELAHNRIEDNEPVMEQFEQE